MNNKIFYIIDDFASSNFFTKVFLVAVVSNIGPVLEDCSLNEFPSKSISPTALKG